MREGGRVRGQEGWGRGRGDGVRGEGRGRETVGDSVGLKVSAST